MEKNRENFLKKGLQGRGIFCRMDACHFRAVCCGNGTKPLSPAESARYISRKTFQRTGAEKGGPLRPPLPPSPVVLAGE